MWFYANYFCFMSGECNSVYLDILLFIFFVWFTIGMDTEIGKVWQFSVAHIYLLLLLIDRMQNCIQHRITTHDGIIDRFSMANATEFHEKLCSFECVCYFYWAKWKCQTKFWDCFFFFFAFAVAVCSLRSTNLYTFRVARCARRFAYNLTT